MPYEEKCEIRAALHALEGPVRTIGFAHAAHNEGLRYFRHGGALSPPRPDLVASTGPDAMMFLRNNFSIPLVGMVSVGSPESTSRRRLRAIP